MSHRISLIALAPALLLAACGATGGWQGAEAEKTYDKNLEAARATQVLNNDDYYEYYKDGKIYVIADSKDLINWQASGELPLRVTRIGAGPKGETVVFAIAQPESKKKDGFGAIEMFEGRRKGAEKDFYAEVFKDDRFYVFGSWDALDAFRKSGSTAGLSSTSGPAGQAVMVAQPSDALMTRFKTLHPQ